MNEEYILPQVASEVAKALSRGLTSVQSINGVTPDPETGDVKITGPDSGQNQNGGGLSTTAAALLIAILRNGMYSTDQSANITALESALASSGDAETPETPESGVEQIGAVLSIVSGVTVTQNGSTLNIA